jgi:hypothetical protein
MNYTIDLRIASQGYDRVTCWTQARAGAIPATAPNENPTVVLTMQKLRLAGSDDYEAIHSMYSTDLGATWSEPILQESFQRQILCEDENGPVERAVCDFSPQWHAASGVLLGTGHTAQYSGGKVSKEYPRVTPYSTYDPATQRWNPWRELKMPDAPQFFRSGAGCTQRVDLDNGGILLPIYFGGGDPYLLSSTVVRCAFDGETLEYIEHGDELSVNVPRGLGEPSLAHFEGRFFLTLRNDEAGYFATSEDGLHFSEPQLWRFDNGEELGNYNTQQHWVTHESGLYLAYTRRGLNNDYVFRNRAPIVMAKVNTDKMRVLRDTEQVIIPNRGARLGNFGVTRVDANESWIVETEWMQNNGSWAQNMLEKLRETHSEKEIAALAATPYLCAACEQFGSNNKVWTAQLIWE